MGRTFELSRLHLAFSCKDSGRNGTRPQPSNRPAPALRRRPAPAAASASHPALGRLRQGMLIIRQRWGQLRRPQGKGVGRRLDPPRLAAAHACFRMCVTNASPTKQAATAATAAARKPNATPRPAAFAWRRTPQDSSIRCMTRATSNLGGALPLRVAAGVLQSNHP